MINIQLSINLMRNITVEINVKQVIYFQVIYYFKGGKIYSSSRNLDNTSTSLLSY